MSIFSFLLWWKQSCIHIYSYLFTIQWLVGWLCFTSHRQRGHLETTPHLLSLAKGVKLGKYTVPTGNQTSGCRTTVHYTTAAPRKLLTIQYLTLVVPHSTWHGQAALPNTYPNACVPRREEVCTMFMMFFGMNQCPTTWEADMLTT